MARLLTARGLPRAASWIWLMASSENRSSAAAGELQVVADVAAGFGVGHAGHLVADGDPLVQGGQHAELDHPAQGGLADQDGGERGAAVHVVVGEHADRFELVVVQEVGFVDDQDGGAAAFGGLAGQHVVGLGGQRGGAVGRGGRRGR